MSTQQLPYNAAMVPVAPVARIQEPKEKPIETTTTNVLRQIEAYLRAKYLFRLNVVSNKVEFKLKRHEQTPFVEMTDVDYNSILREIKLADLSCSIQTIRSLLLSDFSTSYDPYREFMHSLAPWDGATDHIDQIAQTVRTNDDPYWAFCFKKWFVAMAISWIDPEVVNHTAIVFTGPQGIGKTTWSRSLIPESLKRYLFAGKLNLADKDSQIKLSECCLLIMDELENMGSRNIEALKELITKADIYVRPAYGYVHKRYERRASLIGSTNNTDFLHDLTGNRRFLCFEAREFNAREHQHLERAYAQAYALAKQGFQFWFDQAEIERLEQNNEQFRAVIVEEEQLTTYYEPCGIDDPDALFMKTTDVLRNLQQFSGLRTLSDQRLGRVLSALKYVRVKRQERYGYLLKLKHRAE